MTSRIFLFSVRSAYSACKQLPTQSFRRTFPLAHTYRHGSFPSWRSTRIEEFCRAIHSTNRQLEKSDGSDDKDIIIKQQPADAKILQLLKLGTSSLSKGYTRVCESPYGRLLRLDKPIGTNLLFLPAAWSITLGCTSLPEWMKLITLFYGGAVFLRGSGCIINDIWDIDIDRKVQRTRSRPLASNELSINSAMFLLISQLTGGLFVLTQLNELTFLLSSLSLIPVLFYPLAKRRFQYPQLVLGLTFNASCLIGYAAATNSILSSVNPFLMYTACCSWTVVYDTIYAHQDKKDDKQLDIHSTALTFGDKSKLIMMALAAGKYSLLGLIALNSPELLSPIPYFSCLSASALHLVKLIVETDLNDDKQCQRAFNQSTITGTLTWLAFALGRIL